MLAIAGTCSKAADTNDWGPATNGLQMSIRLAGTNEEVRVSEPFSLSVRYRNVSTNEIISVFDYVYREDDDRYSFIVISPSGKDISPTIKPTLDGSGGIHVLHAGQALDLGFKLSELCKFDEAGIYTVTARFRDLELIRTHQAFEVVSNALKIEVVPKKEGNP